MAQLSSGTVPRVGVPLARAGGTASTDLVGRGRGSGGPVAGIQCCSHCIGMAVGGIGVLLTLHLRRQWLCFAGDANDVCSNNLSMGIGQRHAAGCAGECTYFVETCLIGESGLLLVGDAVQELDTGKETDAEIME